MDKKLLDIIVCPLCNSKLSYIKKTNQLVCKFDRLVFPFDDDIPVLIPERASSVTKAQIEQLHD
jgi:uncharacterized protein